MVIPNWLFVLIFNTALALTIKLVLSKLGLLPGSDKDSKDPKLQKLEAERVCCVLCVVCCVEAHAHAHIHTHEHTIQNIVMVTGGQDMATLMPKMGELTDLSV